MDINNNINPIIDENLFRDSTYFFNYHYKSAWAPCIYSSTQSQQFSLSCIILSK